MTTAGRAIRINSNNPTKPTSLSLETPLSKDSVALYKWASISNQQQGRFEMIDKDFLKVDEAYQRPENNKKAVAIAKDWMWVAFGVICVAKRRDGVLVAFDGQHRVLAALKRNDVHKLPCLVFDMDSISDEAKAFLKIQVGRKPVSAAQKYKARKVAGDKVVSELDAILAASGYIVSESSNKPFILKCVARALRLMEIDREGLRAIFPLVADLHGGEAIREQVLDGFFWLYKKTKGEIILPAYRDRFIKLGLGAIHASIQHTIVKFSNHSGKVCAVGICDVFNKGLRKNRITIFDDELEETTP